MAGPRVKHFLSFLVLFLAGILDGSTGVHAESSGVGSSPADLHGEGTILLVVAVCLWSLIALFLLAILLLLVKFCSGSGKRSAADGGEDAKDSGRPVLLGDQKYEDRDDGNKVSHYYVYIGPTNPPKADNKHTSKRITVQTYGSI